jgi:hypothetical protein
MSDQPETDITELEDTEGHGVRRTIEPAGEPDDAEGHASSNSGNVQPAGEPDDTEGHSVRRH